MYSTDTQVPAHLVEKWQTAINLMAELYEVPAGLIMRVHSEEIEVFISSQSGDTNSDANPYIAGERASLQTGLYCETVMANRDQLHIPNAYEDPEWDHNPDIELNMISYLGVPIEWPTGEIFGTVCVLDSKTRHFNKTYKQVIWQFKEIIDGDLRSLAELTYRARIEEELRAAKENAEQANRAKSTFLANMSHELRTPLNAILGFTHLLCRTQEINPKQREYLGIIQHSGEHLLGLINNVLDLSKIEAGRTTLNKATIDLPQMLEELEDMFQMQAEDKHNTLLFPSPADLPQYIHTDELKLKQIFINLISNAAKFTNEGTITVRVRAFHSTGDSSNLPDRLYVEVEDSGPGIAPNELAMLFQPFVQTNTGQQLCEGSGLGLTISREFVRLLGGEMEVRSEVGQGTCFSFTIAFEPIIADEQPTRSSIYNRIIGLAPDQPEYRILVVDDRWTNRHLLGQLLSSVGFAVQEAGNGQEAIDIWEHWEPHLIWMDMRMPVLDGYAATKHIKGSTKGQATAIIALTASALEEDRTVILSNGCDGFVRKPFKEQEIFETIQAHLGVRYLYKDEEDSGYSAKTATSSTEVSAETLALLPSHILQELEKAILMTDPDLIEATATHIRQEHNHALGTGILTLAQNFAYSKLLSLIKETRERK
jgi:signal transduction histidine kinase/CheY-like chemotaxis protein